MWPFRRNRETADAPATEPGAAVAATGPVHRAGPAAWRAAPPMAVVQTSRTTPDSAFVSRLATRADPSFLGRLGHHVLADAPAGAVHGLATPDGATQRTFAPPPGAGPLQRLVADGAPATPASPSPASPPSAAPPTAAPLVPRSPMP